MREQITVIVGFWLILASILGLMGGCDPRQPLKKGEGVYRIEVIGTLHNYKLSYAAEKPHKLPNSSIVHWTDLKGKDHYINAGFVVCEKNK